MSDRSANVGQQKLNVGQERECRTAEHPGIPFPPASTPRKGLRGGGGGVAVLGHPWLDQDPPVRDSPLETGPHRHASNLFSSRFAGRPTQLRPAGHTDEAPRNQAVAKPRNTRKYTQGRPLLKRPAKESKRQQKSLRARSSSFWKQNDHARALKQGPADTEKSTIDSNLMG